MVNDYAYSSNLMAVLWASKVYGAALFVFSVCYFVWTTYCFNGIPVRMASLLLFPTTMLAMDSVFLFLGSMATSSELLCHYNQNINEIPGNYKLQLMHRIICSALRVGHFLTIFRVFIRTFFEKFEILDCIWILSVGNATYNSIFTLIKSVYRYSSFRKMILHVKMVFRRASTPPGQICIICMDELLNCRKLASCGHYFHFKCLFQWIQTKSECPICREPIRLG